MTTIEMHRTMWKAIDLLVEHSQKPHYKFALDGNIGINSIQPSNRISPGGHPRFLSVEKLYSVLIGNGYDWVDWWEVWDKALTEKE